MTAVVRRKPQSSSSSRPNNTTILKANNNNNIHCGLKAVLFMFVLSIIWWMVLFSIFGKRGGIVANGMAPSSSSTTTAAAAAAAAAGPVSFSSSSASRRPSKAELEDRLRGALWGYFAGDALAAPTHWFYGGERQVVAEYGHPITDYTQPNTQLAGSILNKSNLNGGGRSAFANSSPGVDNKSKSSIIGDVINHGKKDLWSPNKSIHYHATLQKGENTLEVQIGRVLMKSMIAKGGTFDVDHFRSMYMDFMMTPNSHNDTYASTCHRMFFANLVYGKLPPEQCPDNDQHNVDTVDGLVLPTIASLVDPSAAGACASATRKSKLLEEVSNAWGQVVQASLVQSDDASFLETLSRFAKQTIRREPNPNVYDSQTMSACYLSQSLPGLVDLTAKYSSAVAAAAATRTTTRGGGDSKNDACWQGLLANANVGGENVHRGSILGAILGARTGASNLPTHLQKGLFPYDQLSREIDDFVAAVMPRLEAEHCCLPLVVETVVPDEQEKEAAAAAAKQA